MEIAMELVLVATVLELVVSLMVVEFIVVVVLPRANLRTETSQLQT